MGTNLFTDLKEIEKKTMLDHSISGYFNQCQLTNEILSMYVFFLRFYERRNKFRYQLKQNLKEKNKMKRELSSCVIQKFNGYELLRNDLNYSEKKRFYSDRYSLWTNIRWNQKNWMFFCTIYFFSTWWIYWESNKRWKTFGKWNCKTVSLLLNFFC